MTEPVAGWPPDDVARFPAAGPYGEYAGPPLSAVPVEHPRPADERPIADQPWLGASMPPRNAGGGGGRRPSPDGGSGADGADGSTEGAADGPSSRRRKRRPQSPLQAALSAVTEVVVVLAMALGLSLLIKTFLVQAFFIPSQSMEDSLLIGDRVLVSKLTPGPFDLHRGDVIVFKDPGGWLQPQVQPDVGPVRHAITEGLTFVGLLPQDSGEHLIKRVIGLPGDTVKCCDAQKRLTVNGIPITEPYVRAGNQPSQEPFTVTVRAGQLWVMGDNRSESADSRLHRETNDGQVPIDDVVGKAFVIVWPFDRFGGVPDPAQVFAAVPSRSTTS